MDSRKYRPPSSDSYTKFDSANIDRLSIYNVNANGNKAEPHCLKFTFIKEMLVRFRRKKILLTKNQKKYSIGLKRGDRGKMESKDSRTKFHWTQQLQKL